MRHGAATRHCHQPFSMPASRSDPVALKKEGNAAFSRGAYAAAVSSYTAAIDLWMEPRDRAILYANRSAARLKIAGEKQKALSDAERAGQLAPDYAKGHFRRAQALRALGRPDDALGALQRVLELSPDDAAAQADLEELRLLTSGPQKPALSGSFQSDRAAVAPTSASPFAHAAPDPMVQPAAERTEARSMHSETEGEVGRAVESGESARLRSEGEFYQRMLEARRKYEEENPKPAVEEKPKHWTDTLQLPPGFGPNEPGWEGDDKFESTLSRLGKMDKEAQDRACATEGEKPAAAVGAQGSADVDDGAGRKFTGADAASLLGLRTFTADAVHSDFRP